MRITGDDLAPNSVLSAATVDDRAELASLCSTQVVERGEHLLRCGDEPRGIGFLLDGAARLAWQIGNRRPVLIQFTGPHDGYIGLREVLGRRPRTTSVTTLTTCRLAVVPAAAALTLFERRPHLLWLGIQELCIGLNRFAQFAADIGVLDLPRQVAKLLLEPTDALPRRRESQDDLASRLGASRQSVNKALTMLHLRGWIERRDDGSLAVREVEAMRRYADGPLRIRRGRPRGAHRDVSEADWEDRGPLLRAFDAGDARQLRAESRTVTYQLGAQLVVEGERLDRVLVPIEGQGLLTTDSGTYGTYVHRSVEPDGSVIGLSALFRDQPATVSLRAQETMRVLEIPRERLASAMRRTPRALQLAGRGIAEEVTGFLRTASELATLSATGRVASVLLNHCDGDGVVRLLLTQRQLAARVGLSRQSVNRALTELRDDKIIEADRGVYHVRDHAALHRLVYDTDE